MILKKNPGPDPALRRLTVTQYRNSVRDLLLFALSDDSLAGDAFLALAPALSNLRPDRRPVIGNNKFGTFRRLAQSIQPSWVEGTYHVGEAAGALLTASPYFNALVPCASNAEASASTCVENFIRRFGERALRRPLSEQQMAFYQAVYGDTERIIPEAFADVVATFVAAPQFAYQVEHGTSDATPSGPTSKLTAYEIASRLAYQYWDTMPDNALWEAAASGTLLTETGFQDQLDRIVRHPKARETFDAFYEEYLLLDYLPPLDTLQDDPVFQAFAGEDYPTPSLREDMIDDVLDFARHVTWQQNGTFDDLLTREDVFPRSQALASIYGINTPYDGERVPPTSTERPGVFTRPGMLANGLVRTSAILRGARLRKEFLCDDPPPPPADADNVAASRRDDAPAMQTSRERADFVTQGARCASCHEVYINPLGFAFEGFDGLGRLRTQEPVFEADGSVVTELPIDTRSVPRVNEADTTPSSGPQDLVRLLQASGKPHACFVRRYARFSWGRLEDPELDGCALSALAQAAQGKATLLDVFKAVALLPAFQKRNFGEPL